MKLFEFVPCGRRPAEAQPPQRPPGAVVEEAAVVPEKRRRRSSGSGAQAWKPTLVAISEDAALTAATAAAKAKAKGKEKPPARVSVRTDCDDFRHFGVPTMVPAFAPTAFLF